MRSWRRHEPVLAFPSRWILMAAAFSISLILVAMGIAFVIVFSRGYFLTQPWDWAVVLLGVGGYFGGMHLLKVWSRYSAKETAAGYTTNPFGFVDADQVHWPSGVVLRDAGEEHLTRGVRRDRMVRVRQYQEWADSEDRSGDER